jgi:hypothetical protein
VLFRNPVSKNTRAALIGALVAAVVMLTLPVVAAVGDALKLGQANSVNAVTSLSGSAPASLRITNNRASSPALDLRVAAGSPPFKVNSTTRVRYLNADLLDGKHMGFFAPATHNHDASYLPLGGKAADADRLDGVNSTDFVRDDFRCAPGATLEGVAADGSAMCSRDYGSRMVDLPPYVVVSPGEQDPDMGLDGNGNPVIAYHYNGKVYVTGCDDPSCSGSEPWAVVDGSVATNIAAPTPHVRVTVEGGYYFSYYHYTATGGVLRLARCSDAACTGGSTTVNLVTGGNPVPWGLAVDTATHHIYLLYEDGGGLKMKDCVDSVFVGGTCPTTTIDAQGTEGSLFVRAGSHPIVAYYDEADDKVYAWQSSTGAKAVANAGASPGATAITRASSGWPVVAFALTPLPQPGKQVWAVQCTAADCSSKSAPQLVGEDPSASGDLALVLASNFPVVAWVAGGSKVAVATCSSADCSGTVTQRYLGEDARGQIGLSVSADGFAVVVYTSGVINIGALRL